MKKTAIILFSMIVLALFTVACASGAVNNAAAATAAANSATSAPATSSTATADTAAADAAASGTLELTLDQLKQYDGKNGNPAYVALDGVIYDVTDVPQWKNGDHNGYSAGNDLTDIIKNKSPHGVKQLNGVPVVGKLIAG
ncbi:MAG: hypothetical protein ABFC56_01975 [Clostridiaceae bacterium]